MTIIAVFIGRNYRTGGHKRYLEALSGLAKRGHNIHLFHQQERTFPKERVEKIILHPLSITKGYSQQKQFAQALKKIDPKIWDRIKGNVIFLFGESSILCGIYLKKKLNLPLVVALRNNFFIADRFTRSRKVDILSDLRNRYKEHLLKRFADKQNA